MKNGPFIDEFPITTSICKGFSVAMLNNQRVLVLPIKNHGDLQFALFVSDVARHRQDHGQSGGGARVQWKLRRGPQVGARPRSGDEKYGGWASEISS